MALTREQVAQKVEARINKLYIDGFLPDFKDWELDNITLAMTELFMKLQKERKK